MKLSESLKKNRDFQYVYRNGRSFANKYFIMYVLENNQDRNYIGISVSKKVGNMAAALAVICGVAIIGFISIGTVLHGYLAIVFGTVVIFCSGFIFTMILDRRRK